MPTIIGTGFSSASDPIEAVRAAAVEVKAILNTVHSDVVLVFSTASYLTTEALSTVQRILQPEHLIGATTPAVIVNNRIEPRGVGILAIVSDEIHFASASLENFKTTLTRENGSSFAQVLLKHQTFHQRNGCFYFFNGLYGNGNAFYTGIQDILGYALPIAGAIGVESLKNLQSQYSHQEKLLKNAATGLLIGGANTVTVATRYSWQPLGKPHIIDESTGHIIKTIDGQPAAELYKNYFLANDTENASTRNDIHMLYPLGINTNIPREYLIRNPVDILQDGSIVCQGDVPAGSKVHLMITNKDTCRQSVTDAAQDLRKKMLGKPPKLIIIFESLIRQKILGRGASQNLLAIHEIFGHHIPTFGMYTFGETSPLRTPQSSTATQLSNGSITLLAIG
ncbi:MAG: FIST N-terminal domain-containing protein [Candidatus Omnitrophota bacterium]